MAESKGEGRPALGKPEDSFRDFEEDMVNTLNAPERSRRLRIERKH